MSVWLAVLAILVQTIVPDFAMADRNTARQTTEAAAAHHADHQHHDGSTEPNKPAPAEQHHHEELCAFCLALNTQGTPMNGGLGLATPVHYTVAVVPERPGIRPSQLFHFGSKPRAPPSTGLI
ncbi:DUF2946 domain-containing protein [Azospirillum canadense]|uniref:DUF2946 domain-containing protein n=1 Tax=Azospirillum canadense TaxID=403962 RepID=UPI0022261C7B|nr:DUF2946 domain-containing protein [Azospirillum canadense]MCW2241481.1 hypothetical protein [Azospirillum canadense]